MNKIVEQNLIRLNFLRTGPTIFAIVLTKMKKSTNAGFIGLKRKDSYDLQEH